MSHPAAFLTAILILGSQITGVQRNSSAVVAGEFIVEPPTLVSLGFEWKIEGDDNRNATVTVEYRRRGESQWRETRNVAG
jgi:hypothetical protein